MDTQKAEVMMKTNFQSNLSASNRSSALFRSATALLLLLSVALCSFAPSSFADEKSDLDDANAKASEASAVYDEACAKQEELTQKISETTARIDDLERNQLPEKQSKFNSVVYDMYTSSVFDPVAIIMSFVGEKDLSNILYDINAYEHIAKWRQTALEELKDARAEIANEKAKLEEEKVQADTVLEEARVKKEEALETQESARAAYQAAHPSSIATTRRAPTSSTFNDEESARAFIVMKESGGNYNARSATGKYIGAYQLTNTYLNGDYSPENQDRVAEQYVKNRYGSWVAAANFWVAHGWY